MLDALEPGTDASAQSAQVLNASAALMGNGARRVRVSVKEIQELVAEYYQLASDDLTTDRRTRKISRPRQVAMWLSRKFTPNSLPVIGRRFGGRHHTTVMHAIRRVDELCAEDPALAAQVEFFVRILQ